MKKIMDRAWEIARKAVKEFGGKVKEYFAIALRMAWEEVKNVKKAIIDRIDELTALGFNRWQKNGMDRLYINAATLGLNCEYYRTGNIHRAEFNGSEISNSEAYRMKAAKTYIDVKLEKVYSDNSTLGEAAAKLAGLEY